MRPFVLHSNEIQTVTQIDRKTPLHLGDGRESFSQSSEALTGSQSALDGLDPYEVKYLDLDTARADLSDYRGDVVAALWKSDRDAAVRYAKCGSESLGVVGYCPECEASNPDFFVTHKTHSCMLRICPDCAKRDAMRLQGRYEKIIRHLHNLHHPKRRLRHITLTRNLPLSGWNPEAASEIMNQAMQLYESMIKAGWLHGVIASLEVGEVGALWHVHMVAYCEYIDQQDLSEAWASITGGDSIVHIREFKTAGEAIREGLKYAAKFANLQPSQLADLHHSLKGKRRVRSRGVFYKHVNNPFHHLLQDDDFDGCDCPQCGSVLEYVGVDKFLTEIAYARPWLVGLDIDRVVEFERAALGILNLTEANKSRGQPPP